MFIDCRAIAMAIDEKTTLEVSRLKKLGTTPRICEVIATDNESVFNFVRTKRRKAQELGFKYEPIYIESTERVEDVVKRIERLNDDNKVHGIMVGMPTFPQLDKWKIVNAIAKAKDIDGSGYSNFYHLYNNEEYLAITPAAATAVIHILETVSNIVGERILILGRGQLVGLHSKYMLLNRNATIMVAHSRSTNMSELFDNCDIVVSAMGRPGCYGEAVFRRGMTLIDCGSTSVGGNILGDFDSEKVERVGVNVTKVPGGMGLVTNSVLFANTVKAIALQ